MSYLNFSNLIDKNNVKVIFELGSRDLKDALLLESYYSGSSVYSFECNPDCLVECKKKH
jgi:hypothetical protein